MKLDGPPCSVCRPRFTRYACPHCDVSVRVRFATSVSHECEKRGYRLVEFVKVPHNASNAA